MNSKQKERTVFQASAKVKIFAYAVLGLYTVIVMYPLLFLVLTSLKSNAEFFVNLYGIPRAFAFDNYPAAWSTGGLGRYFFNSLFVTLISVLLNTAATLLGGYALAKLRIRKADLIMSVFMTFNFIPGIAIYISLYTMLNKIHVSGFNAMILPYVAWHIPLSMYIFKQYFETIPHELIESGRIDGCGEFRTFLSIMMPLVVPAIATVVVFNFISIWGELMWANIITSADVSIKTLPVGLLNFKTEMGVNWGQYTAGICMVTVPLMLIFGFCQKYFVAGLTNGAVKG